MPLFYFKKDGSYISQCNSYIVVETQADVNILLLVLHYYTSVIGSLNLNTKEQV